MSFSDICPNLLIIYLFTPTQTRCILDDIQGHPTLISSTNQNVSCLDEIKTSQNTSTLLYISVKIRLVGLGSCLRWCKKKRSRKTWQGLIERGVRVNFWRVLQRKNVCHENQYPIGNSINVMFQSTWDLNLRGVWMSGWNQGGVFSTSITSGLAACCHNVNPASQKKTQEIDPSKGTCLSRITHKKDPRSKRSLTGPC